MSNNAKVVTLGEIMLRLSPPGYNRFVQSNQFDVHYGGAEANVAVALAGFGIKSFFVSRMPEHEIGEAALQCVRKYNVNLNYILRGGKRIGVYFIEKGSGQRPSKVIYDRKDSSLSQIDASMFNWEEIFEGKDWFHWSGITPALGKGPAEVIKQACQKANKAGVKISCDLNYRSKLWTEKNAQSVMIPLMEYVDVCIANEEHATKCLNLDLSSIDYEKNRFDRTKFIARTLKKKFNFQSIAMTLRETISASKGAWSAVLHDDKDAYVPVRSTRYEFDIIDRVGAGDAFSAGLIYGLQAKKNSKDALEFAAAVCCLKHSIPGDLSLVRISEVDDIISGKTVSIQR